jgi:hypothetical protein
MSIIIDFCDTIMYKYKFELNSSDPDGKYSIIRKKRSMTTAFYFTQFTYNGRSKSLRFRYQIKKCILSMFDKVVDEFVGFEFYERVCRFLNPILNSE